MVAVGIVGASGYTGEELTKLLQGHPEVELTALTSRTHAGKKVNEVFALPKNLDTTFLEPNIKNLKNCDVVFFATPNGTAMKMANELLDHDIRIIDISSDFRLTDYKVWEQWYNFKHVAQSLLEESVYGLPEIPNQKSKIEKARIVGARALQLSLGAPSFIEIPKNETTSLQIAIEELTKKLIPIVIRRILPNGDYQNIPIDQFK